MYRHEVPSGATVSKRAFRRDAEKIAGGKPRSGAAPGCDKPRKEPQQKRWKFFLSRAFRRPCPGFPQLPYLPRGRAAPARRFFSSQARAGNAGPSSAPSVLRHFRPTGPTLIRQSPDEPAATVRACRRGEPGIRRRVSPEGQSRRILFPASPSMAPVHCTGAEIAAP
jgi:hypothetical protein